MRASEWRGIVNAVGGTCRNLRYTLAWSQQDLADKANVSQGAISRLEASHLGVPLFTIVKVMRVLGDGLVAAELPVSPAATHLLNFVRMISGDFSVTQAIDPELTNLIRSFNKMSPAQRTALVSFVRTVTELGGNDAKCEQGPTALHGHEVRSSQSWEGHRHGHDQEAAQGLRCDQDSEAAGPRQGG